jgi:hypothetical protein
LRDHIHGLLPHDKVFEMLSHIVSGGAFTGYRVLSTGYFYPLCLMCITSPSCTM